MKEVFDNEPNNPTNEVEIIECFECGAPVDNGEDYCSFACFKASMI